MHKQTLILFLSCLLILTGHALAEYDIVTVAPSMQEITIASSETYTITVDTDVCDAPHTISFDTRSADILATLTGNGVNIGDPSETGSDTWTPTSAGTYDFTLTVTPQSGAAVGDMYTVEVMDDATNGHPIKGGITATVIPKAQSNGNGGGNHGSGGGTYPPTPTPTLTPTPTGSSSNTTAAPTPTPTLTPTPTQSPSPTPTSDDGTKPGLLQTRPFAMGFGLLFLITALLALAYFLLSRRR